MADRVDAILKTVESVVEEAREHEEAEERAESIEKYKLAAETIQSVVDSIKDLSEEESEALKAKVDEWLEAARQQQNVESSKPISKGEERRGAAVVGAAAGMAAGSMVGLPILGLAGGAVLATNAMDRDDKIGQGTGKLGRLGAKALREAEKINKKYDISGKAKKAATVAAKELNKQLHKASKHTANAAGKLLDEE